MLRPWDKKVGEGKIKTTIVSRDGTVPEYINRGSKTYRLAHHTVDPSVLLGFTFADATYREVEKVDSPNIKWPLYPLKHVNDC